MRISVSMIVLNEARNIGRAIASCSFADEIVVVDGGSTDRTAEILEGRDRVVLVRKPWPGHFGEQRQVSLDHCTGDWVIRLDADEAFSEEFERGIRATLQALPGDVAACTIRQCNLVGNESFYSKAYDSFEGAPRIWRNRPGVRWEGHVHERPVGIEGKVASIDAYVIHYGFLDRNRYGEKGSAYAQIPGSGFGSSEELVFREYDIQPRPARSAAGSHVPPYMDSGSSREPGPPRVAIVRGANLNPWEMQNYEPLSGRFEITAYTTTKPNFDVDGVRLPVVRLPADANHPGGMQGLEFALFDEDLVYSADTTWRFTFQASRIREKFGKKLVCLQWENIPFAYEESGEMKKLKEAARRHADHFIAVTERAREALVLEGVDPSRVTVIPMGIDTERFRPDAALRQACRKRLGIADGEKLVLFAGRMVWEKGVYDFVHAAALAQASLGNVPVRYVMVGKGPERDAVIGRVAELGLSASVTFIESHPYDRMRELFNAADVFVLPSISTRMWKEQFGMVLAEAMACGAPVVSTTSGSIPEVVGDAGILVPANDPGELSRAICRLCRDDAFREELRVRGRKRAVETFDSGTVAEKVGEVFARVLATEDRPGEAVRVPRIGGEAPGRTPAGPAGGVSRGCADAGVRPAVRVETRYTESAPATAPAAGDPYHQQERREILGLVPAGASKILDVGCGEGILGKRLLENGASEVVGIELDPAVASRARGNLSRVLEGDVQSLNLPFADGYFDCIIVADVLEHLRDPLAVLTRLKRYLSDTGTVVASIPNVRYFDVMARLAEGRWEYGKFGILDETHLRFFTRKEMAELFSRAGFELAGISENLSPLYGSLPPGHTGDISFGRVTLHNQSRQEAIDLFVYQYLLTARKQDSVAASRDRCVTAALASGNAEAARAALDEYLEAHPLDAEALLRRSDLLARLGQSEEALEDLGRVLLFDPGREDALARKAAIQAAGAPAG